MAASFEKFIINQPSGNSEKKTREIGSGKIPDAKSKISEQEIEKRKAEIYENGEGDIGTGQFEYRLDDEEPKKKKARKLKPAVKQEKEESVVTAENEEKIRKPKKGKTDKAEKKKAAKKSEKKDSVPPAAEKEMVADAPEADVTDKVKTEEPIPGEEEKKINIPNEADDSEKAVMAQGREYEEKTDKLYKVVPGQSGAENLSYDEITEKTKDEQAEEIIELTEADEIKELELLADEPGLKEVAEDTIKEIKGMDRKEKKKLFEGLANIGFMTTQVKGRILKNFCSKLSQVSGKNNFLGKYFDNYSDIYEKSEYKAGEMREITGKTRMSRAFGLGQGAGNAARYLRVIYDLVDSGSARMLNPFRHVTVAAMFVGRSAEAAKETRFGYESVKEKTRIKDQERAYDEAWRIYEEAKKKNDTGELTGEELEEAYKENLPKDIQERFKRGGVEMTKWYKIYFDKSRDVKVYADRMTNKLEKIESDEKLSAEEKDRQRKGLLLRNKGLIDDLDRMVGDQGAIDNIAYGSRMAEKLGKGVATALIIDSVWRLARGAAELSNIFDKYSKGVDLNVKPPSVTMPMPKQPSGMGAVLEGAFKEAETPPTRSGMPEILGDAFPEAKAPTAPSGMGTGPGLYDNDLEGGPFDLPKTEPRVPDPDDVTGYAPVGSAEKATSELLKPIEIKAGEGDSVWSMSEKYLNERFKDRFAQLDLGDPKTAEALKTYDIDRLKDVISADPEKYGLPKGVSFEKLSVEHLNKVDYDRAINDAFPSGDPVTGLTGAQVENIVRNNATLKEFFAQHPDTPRTAENFEKILRGEQILGHGNISEPFQSTGEIKEPSGINQPERVLTDENFSPDNMAEIKTAGKDLDLIKLEQIAGDSGITPEMAVKAIPEILSDGLDDEKIKKFEWWVENVKSVPTPEDARLIFETAEVSELKYAEAADYLELLRGTADLDPIKRANLVELFAGKGDLVKPYLFAGTGVLEKMHELKGEVIPLVRQGNLELVYKFPNASDITLKFTPEGRAYAEGPWLLDKHFKSLKNINEILKFPLEATNRFSGLNDGPA